ncbi:MAG TPA: hypothetical protein VIJ96_19050 [Acidothermaceae bacterium]
MTASSESAALSAEHARLAASPDASSPWRLWGPYVSGRQWGTVREDYSADGDAWAYFPFEQAHRRAYRWGEDGLGAYCDRYGFLNIGVALWNGADPLLKERLFGLTNAQGNHGEDVKEYWWALDGTPTHSWARWLYRYPQVAYPYDELRQENARRGRADREYELADTGVFDNNRFFDVTMTWAKAGPDDVCLLVEATNHGVEAAPLHLLPQLWFRNTWAWGRDPRKAQLRVVDGGDDGVVAVECEHAFLGRYVVAASCESGVAGEVLVCDNETDAVSLFGAVRNASPFPKDGINRRVVHGESGAVNPDGVGTKAALWWQFDSVAPGQTVRVRVRMARQAPDAAGLGDSFDAVLAARRADADQFYAAVLPARLDDEGKAIARRAFAGLLWGKQLYRYSVQQWLEGDPAQPAPPPQRMAGRNAKWTHLALADVISMPDDWEYPWFAAWDLAFHCVTLTYVDPAFAKNQLLLLCREWAMHPDGQLPAYEWAFGDVNPPVHAWAAWQVFLIDGARDHDFLARVFTKCVFAFGWWVNCKDPNGSNLFEGGFLGMDNISLFNRSQPLPSGCRLEQSDATSWMAFFCLTMLKIAVELAHDNPIWDDSATKFLEHFLLIARAVRSFGSHDVELWDDDDGFFYDVFVSANDTHKRLRVRSMVGLLPLLAVARSPAWSTNALPDLTSRLAWLRKRRPAMLDGLLQRADGDVSDDGSSDGGSCEQLLSLVDPQRLVRVVARMLDEAEFLSQHGLRSLSAAYRQPYTQRVDGQEMSIDYEPGESRTALFGGNSNWRGPIWFPVNVLLVAALREYGSYFGDTVTVEFPSGTGDRVTLTQAAQRVEQRLVSLFRRGSSGRRPCDGSRIEATDNPLWREHITFSEYFDGDTGEGLGSSHQTGWTALVAHLLCQDAKS